MKQTFRVKRGVTPGGRTYTATRGDQGYKFSTVEEKGVSHSKVEHGKKISSTKGVIEKSFTKPAKNPVKPQKRGQTNVRNHYGRVIRDREGVTPGGRKYSIQSSRDPSVNSVNRRTTVHDGDSEYQKVTRSHYDPRKGHVRTSEKALNNKPIQKGPTRKK